MVKPTRLVVTVVAICLHICCESKRAIVLLCFSLPTVDGFVKICPQLAKKSTTNVLRSLDNSKSVLKYVSK